MKVALVTTTINIPTVLSLYRAYGPYIGFFVAGDAKTPPACEEFIKTLGPNSFYLSLEKQNSLGYKCSELLGENTIARRNIATLESLKWGADIIVMVDDDNIPMNEFYFADHVNAMTKLHDGVGVIGQDGWFDVGQLLFPYSPHRGVPHNVFTRWNAEPVVNAKVGVNAGICMGDPDISAYFRMANHPLVHLSSRLLDGGIIVANGSRTVFNSQNTSFIRELAPAMFLMPGIGRMDDIWASLICQRVMKERGLYVRFGHPYIWQSRNPHDLVSDLKAEMHGMENTAQFAAALDAIPVGGGSVLEQVRAIYKADEKYLPTKSVMSALAFLEDCGRVM